jgi:hypothetical protein
MAGALAQPLAIRIAAGAVQASVKSDLMGRLSVDERDNEP